MSSEIENEGKSTESRDTEEKEIIPGYKTLDDFTKDGYNSLTKGIVSSNGLPTGHEYNYYNTNDTFSRIINKDGNHILKLMKTILQHYETDANIHSRSLDEKNELLIEANDNMLERVANNIDEMNGIRKTTNEPIVIQTVSAELPKVNGSWNRISNLSLSVGSSISQVKKQPEAAIRLLTAKNIIRPQTFFKDKIINSSQRPWEPRIKEKPNSLKPLAIFLEETEKGEEFSHPYEFELDRFEPLPEQLLKEEPVKPLPVSETPLVEISQPEQIDELVEILRNCKEFAVDLEHHSYRTFMGITCLMQISTRTTDFIIDTIALRDKLYVLNEVFTKPTIVKIFHGADLDIQWLQRDLSIYVVNLFDTHQAARQLQFTSLSLAYLLNRYCNFVPNKQFQLADWRIRPLPEELKKYAREDTHYLIYIYQMLKIDLLEKANGQTNLLAAVIKNSTEIAKRRYFKPILRDDSYMDFYRKCRRIFDNRQLYALKELYNWRDIMARNEDESTGYVLPNHMLLQISEALPREVQGILACCNPIPPLVRANLLELHRFILKARDQPLEKAILQEDTRARGTTKKISKINVDSPLNCPHDLSKISDFRDDLPAILNKTFLNKGLLTEDVDIECENSICSVFNSINIEVRQADQGIPDKLQNVTFLGPFERYKLVRPFIQAQERKEEEERAKEEKEKSKGQHTVSDSRTDEERIEAIRQHFLNLSRLSAPSQPDVTSEKSLLQMGGNKKRRRNESSPDNEDQDNISLQTSIPRFNKRKSTEPDKYESPKKIRKQKKGGYWRRNIKKSWNQNFNNSNNETIDAPGVSNQQVNQGDDSQEQGQLKQINRNRNKKKQNKNQWKACDVPNKGNFQPYDYSTVDFRQFQGGASDGKGQNLLKSKFKPKRKWKGANRGNKSGSFGTVRMGTEYGK